MDSIKFNKMNEITGLTTFISSIDWREPWLVLLLVCHGIVMLSTFATRHYLNVQSVLFLIFLSLVYFSDYLNELGAKHWKKFSREQYFDSSGMFISVVFSMPLLFNCLIIVCYWLWTSGNLLIKLKRAQLRSQNNSSSISSKDKKSD